MGEGGGVNYGNMDVKVAFMTLNTYDVSYDKEHNYICSLNYITHEIKKKDAVKHSNLYWTVLCLKGKLIISRLPMLTSNRTI